MVSKGLVIKGVGRGSSLAKGIYRLILAPSILRTPLLHHITI